MQCWGFKNKLKRILIKSKLELNSKIKRKRFLSQNIQSFSKKGLNIKDVEISPLTSVSSSCDENSTQATRNKAAKSKNLTSILVGLAQKPEGMAKGVLFAHFIDLVNGSISYSQNQKPTHFVLDRTETLHFEKEEVGVIIN